MKLKKIIKKIHIPTAENTFKETEPQIIIKWIERIEEAKKNGGTHCYLCVSDGAFSKNALKKFLEKGYDIKYQLFDSDGSLFVKAFWHEGCNGRLYDEERKEYVDVETMFKLLHENS